jgi:hypothetical protein
MTVVLGGKKGTFVLEDHGTYEKGAANSVLEVIRGSGTGELRGITGMGSYSASQSGAELELDYDL